ncbi:MAG: helix-turn-helix domain-containing protein [Actinomycetia bacterium]|nr:helix-turn-helix domain-containing protein [Actinomycetes bacterium]
MIGTALAHKPDGLGQRRIATVIDRPVSTVRRWLRRLSPAHLDRNYQGGYWHWSRSMG